MQLSTIIPQFLLPERELLAIYCYLLRLVKPAASKQLVDGAIVTLRPYEVCVTNAQAASDLHMDATAVATALQKFVDLELMEWTTEGDTIKVRFKYLVLPAGEEKSRHNVTDNLTNTPLDEFIPEYLEFVRTNMSPRTYDNYAGILNAFAEWIGRINIGEITAAHLEKYKNGRKGTVSDHTINIHIRTLKAAMELAKRWGKIQENPFRVVKAIRTPQKATPSLTKEEYLLLRKKIQEPWLRDIVDFDILTGLRLGELVNLTWSDVDLVKGIVTIKSTAGYQVKHGKMRVIPLHPEAMVILQHLQNESGPVFRKDDGTPPACQFISKKFKAYVRSAGLSEEYHFHSLRATFASWCANSGVSLYTLQNLMGHSSITVTESYTSPDQSNARTELSRITLSPIPSV